MSEVFASTLKSHLPAPVQRAFDRLGDVILSTSELPNYRGDPEVCRLHDMAETIFRKLSAGYPDGDYTGALVAARDLEIELERKLSAGKSLGVALTRNGGAFDLDNAFSELSFLVRERIVGPGRRASIFFDYDPSCSAGSENFRLSLSRPSDDATSWKIDFSECWIRGLSRYPHSHSLMEKFGDRVDRLYVRLHDNGVDHSVELGFHSQQPEQALRFGRSLLEHALDAARERTRRSGGEIITVPMLLETHGVPGVGSFETAGRSVEFCRNSSTWTLAPAPGKS